MPGVYAEDGNLYIALPIENVGAAPVLRVQIDSIRVASGSLLTPAALPLVLGDIAPGERALLDASFAMPNMNDRNASLVVSGTYLLGNELLDFTLHRALAVPQAAGETKAKKASAEPHTQLDSPFQAQPLPPSGESGHEQAEVPPVPIGPFRQGSTALNMEVQIPGPNAATPTYTTMGPSDPLIITRNTSFANNAGDPPDMSGASGGRVVLATANTFLAVSVDDGVNFSMVDPSTIWSDVASPPKTARAT
jgi:hypothetical protein